MLEPLAHRRAVDAVVVDPAIDAGVVRRVDVQALHLARVLGQQRFQREQVVALDDEIAAGGVAARELGHFPQRPRFHALVVIDDGIPADPAQRRHAASLREPMR